MSVPTIQIIHPVSIPKEYLLGFDLGFPEGDQFLSGPVIRQAVAVLMSHNVKPFEDGKFHGEINTFGMADILNDVSEATAIELGFYVQPVKPGSNKKIMTIFGVRWEIAPEFREVRIYGPASDLENLVTIDLTKGAV